MNNLEKLFEAKKMIMEVELDLIGQIGYSPYEMGYVLRSLEDAIDLVTKLNP
jgi:hypothetical protein